MWRRLASYLAIGLLIAALPRLIVAQESVTISGHVTAASLPVRGANVGIATLGLSAATDADGRYSFIVPSARVRGQNVTLTARYLRYRPRSATIALVGGTVVQDFEMRPTAGEPTSRDTQAQTARDTSAAAAVPRSALASLGVVDSSAFGELAGGADLGSALAGRIAGLRVTSASTPGGSSALTFRGLHSIAAAFGPLFVVDGVPVDNSNFNDRNQQFGLGGFDYGNPIADLNVNDIASATLLDPAAATMLYGGRAANGVILIASKNGHGLNGFDVAASQQVTSDSPLRLPVYQNSYGQGLNGGFEFLDGQGGGLNDGVAASWGPALSGQPLSQASLTAPRRGDVRFWLARPDNVRGYFVSGRTLTTNASVQGANERGNVRLAASNRSVAGLTPNASSHRQTVALTASRSFTSRFSASVNGQFANDRGSDLPGTGFNPGNPVADFSMLGRQVDVQALKRHTRDSLGNQINWIYTTHNNPYFQALQNSNQNRRSRVLGGVSATYAFAPGLEATVRTGADSYHDTRDFRIASGWMDGFPYYPGKGDFSSGGFQKQNISANETNSELFIRSHPSAPGSLTLTAGVSRRGNGLRESTVGADRAALPPDTATAAYSRVLQPEQLFSMHTDALFGGAQVGVGDYLVLDGALRGERTSMSGGQTSGVYPSVSGSFDLGRAFAPLQAVGLASTRLRASWSRSGNQVTPAAIQTAYFGSDTSGYALAAPGQAAAAILPPELTNTWEVGAGVHSSGNRLGLDLTYYSDRSSGVLLPGTFAPGSAPSGAIGIAGFAPPAGVLANRGVEAQLSVVPIRAAWGFDWGLVLDYARNASRVESLNGAATSLALGPQLWGLSVEARTGQPLPALVGSGFRRDSASGQLLLMNGHPLPESVDRRRVLGVAEPKWTSSLASTMRIRAVELDFLIDAHVGGSVFSATNMWGAVSGNSAETAFRPDSGLLIRGLDVATGKANARHVSTQDYYRSLLGIQEPWVYDASFVKLRDVRLSVALPLHALGLFTAQSLRAALIGRNLYLAARAPNIDPETTLGGPAFQGVELGQLPTVKSVGIQISIVP